MTYDKLRIALFGNVYQTEKNQYVEAIICKLASLGVCISFEKRFATFVEESLGIDLTPYPKFDLQQPCTADIAISIGGDGTFLGTASQVGASGIPILGINTGRLGFLADVSPENVGVALEGTKCTGRLHQWLNCRFRPVRPQRSGSAQTRQFLTHRD